MITAYVNEGETASIENTPRTNGAPLGTASASEATIEYFSAQLHKNPKELPPMTVRKALLYIARSAEPESAALVLARIAADKQLDAGVRQDAVNALGMLPMEFADPHLAIVLQEAHGERAFAALKAVAISGGKLSLKALRSLDPCADPQVLKLRAYAETMLTLRLKEAPTLEPANSVFPSFKPIKVVELSAEALKVAIDSVEGKPFSMKFSEEIGFSLNCAHTKHSILFNSTFRRGAIIKHCLQTQIAGIVVAEDKATGRNVLRYAILFRHDKAHTQISVLSTTGEVAMTGELHPDRDGLSFNLREVAFDIGPIQIAGIVRDNYIELEVKVYRGEQDKRDARSIN